MIPGVGTVRPLEAPFAHEKISTFPRWMFFSQKIKPYPFLVQGGAPVRERVQLVYKYYFTRVD